MRSSALLIPSRHSNLGIFQLNHPKAFHALTLDMVEALLDQLVAWRKDESVKAILFRSEGTKRPVFCAGGDVKTIYQAGIDGKDIGSSFFYTEYQANHQIGTYNKPIISYWDGIVMGGGVGLSIHGSYRVATENSLLAMPETAIGLFPDVGSLYWMPRLLSQGMANYCALTGHRLVTADLVQSGLATHYVPSEKLDSLTSALADATDNVEAILNDFHEEVPGTEECFIAQNQEAIEGWFGGTDPKLEGIVEQLTVDSSELAQKSLKTLSTMSPTSLKLTLEGLKRGAACKDLAEDLRMEYRLGKAICEQHAPTSDFFSGVKAVLVDKDPASARWNPAIMEDVSEEYIYSFFKPLPSEEEEWKPAVV